MHSAVQAKACLKAFLHAEALVPLAVLFVSGLQVVPASHTAEAGSALPTVAPCLLL